MKFIYINIFITFYYIIIDHVEGDNLNNHDLVDKDEGGQTVWVTVTCANRRHILLYIYAVDV